MDSGQGIMGLGFGVCGLWFGVWGDFTDFGGLHGFLLRVISVNEAIPFLTFLSKVDQDFIFALC